ncbi:tetratricopeptide repeat protein [Subsaximicrobium wynnwilliamsii]|jgi:tetratricopeptide (TPR) repeat protein|uniref:Tetratricopeptide repeat protein n=1 Tax=Subsaximicrobium wynnwilliamsii TaxID=291179 RepID=A0A5C6ZLB6_9FLAO|nr:tetratricopeptide repeat protein [Subsaximicrobium wynnwilliamsii]TXD85095.1 tetratricopeptide repeat protein [Subsaximicrobium wynnwilliamsii]TXD91138.1 tetratricopeptide repeat protein [Subsaximicrobium wynnwilliamsii]TXE04532.1 tetratricopeptide repeat protein [Subsaximicrobium wynnwilliamsii]
MATYKKRGYKPKTEKEKTEVIEDNSTTAEVFNTLDEGANKAELWVGKNQKGIFIIIGVAAVILLGYLAYNKFIAGPKAEEAMNEMFTAQKYFNQAVTGESADSLYTLALKGGEGKFGMVDIASEYSGTPAGNLANYYAGMAYLNTKDYTNAVKYLSDFTTDDAVLGPVAKGGIGDSFVQLNQLEDALDYYEKAISASTNDYTTPMYLFKAGNVAQSLGQKDKALQYFERIQQEFSDSDQAKNIEVFIGRAEASAN